MCGICGFNWEDKNLLDRMLSRMEHRGPDHSGTFLAKGMSLGYDRLSIIDLKNGNQPIYNEDRSLVLFFNGEIYNHRELTKKLERMHRFESESDSEVIIHAYEEYGMEFLKHLRGMFAIALYDVVKGRLILARDHLGIKPLYYYHNRDRFLFASEIKSLLEYEEIPRKVNPAALKGYLTLRYCSGTATMFSGIKKLPPAGYLVLSEDRLEQGNFWRIRMAESEGSLEGFKKRFLELYQEVIRQHMISDVPIGVLLSGGIDSSSIVAMIRRQGSQKIPTYTIGFDSGFKNEFSDAKKVSDLFGTDHHEFTISSSAMDYLPNVVWHLDEPVADPTAIPNYILSRKAKVKVLLNGDGADELFGGYEQYKIMRLHHSYSGLPGFIRKTISFPLRALPQDPFFLKLKQFASPETTRQKAYEQLISVFGDKEKDKLASGRKWYPGSEGCEVRLSEGLSHTNQMLEHDVRTYLPDNMLLKYDKITMANSIEGRVPFCDSRIAEFAFSLPSELKLHGMNDKYLLRESMRGILPEDIVRKKKQRFLVPTDDWLTKGFGSFSRDLLSSEKRVVSEYFDSSYLERLYTKSISSRFLSLNSLTRLYYSRQLWTITNFVLWHKIFIDDDRSLIRK